MNIKVLHIVSALNASSGGPTRSISGICKALAERGVDITLFVHSFNNDELDLKSVDLVLGSGKKLPVAWRELKKVFLDVNPDIVHLHGLWMPTNHLAMTIARKYEVPVVLSVRGMLDPWALKQKRLKKLIALKLFQRSDLESVCCFHATASREKDNIRRQNLMQPVCVIPNGVNIPTLLPVRNYEDIQEKRALFLSRLHPGKGLMDLVDAWGMIRPEGWKVVIVGPDVCGHRSEVEERIFQLGLNHQFVFMGELNDSEKWTEYAKADLFIHPSHSENFGISIAEALVAGLPVVATTGTPWKILNEIKSGWWIDPGAESLVNNLPEILSLDVTELRKMGQRGRKYAVDNFAWSSIATEMRDVYKWILGDDRKPKCVFK